MVVVRIPERDKEIVDQAEAKSYLASIGIEYDSWKADAPVRDGATQEEVLSAYSSEIEELKSREGYTTADVIDINRNTAGLQEMLDKFNKEHWHDEDEVRFTIAGSGVFHIHPKEGDVVAIEVHPGDLIRVPRGTHHWFDLCDDKRIRAIRLFQNKSGWTPYYTGSGVDSGYQPVCMGPSYFSPGQ